MLRTYVMREVDSSCVCNVSVILLILWPFLCVFSSVVAFCMVPYSCLSFKKCSAEWIGGKPCTYQHQRFIDARATYPKPKSTLHVDTWHGWIEHKCSTQNGLSTTYGPVSYWLWYKTHHKHDESTSLITYCRNVISIIALLTWKV